MTLTKWQTAAQINVQTNGELWSVVLNGVPTSFYGIFDETTDPTGDSLGKLVPLDAATLKVTTVFAASVAFGAPLTRAVDGNVWKVINSFKQTNAVMTHLIIQNLNTTTVPAWSGPPPTFVSASYAAMASNVNIANGLTVSSSAPYTYTSASADLLNQVAQTLVRYGFLH